MKKANILMGAFLGLSLGSAAFADKPVAAADAKFMKTAAHADIAEVHLGKLAAEKGTHADVKAFGQMMVDDHTKASDELKGLAEQKKVKLPTAPSPPDKAAHNRLSKLSGDAFDRAYAMEMVKAHRKAVQLFTTESKAGKDDDAKAWAAKTLPTLEAHLKKAQDLAEKTAKK